MMSHLLCGLFWYAQATTTPLANNVLLESNVLETAEATHKGRSGEVNNVVEADEANAPSVNVLESNVVETAEATHKGRSGEVNNVVETDEANAPSVTDEANAPSVTDVATHSGSAEVNTTLETDAATNIDPTTVQASVQSPEMEQVLIVNKC